MLVVHSLLFVVRRCFTEVCCLLCVVCVLRCALIVVRCSLFVGVFFHVCFFVVGCVCVRFWPFVDGRCCLFVVRCLLIHA